MGKSKPRTERQINQAKDAHLQKSYNITLADRAYLESLHDGKCWICNRPPGTRSLHVDHDHSYKKVPIYSTQDGGIWDASAYYNGATYNAYGPKKSLAVRDLKRMLLRASVRGMLCYSHNTAIARFRDNTEDLIAAAEYLTNFKEGGPLRLKVHD